MNRRKITITISLFLISLFLLAGVALAAPTQTVDSYVFSGGGGHAASSEGTYTLDGTIGQPIAGTVSEDLCSGFWCNAAELLANFLTYLPTILK